MLFSPCSRRLKLNEQIWLSSSILLDKIKNDTKNNAPGELKVEHLNLCTKTIPTQHWIPSLIVKVVQGENGFGTTILMAGFGSKVVLLTAIETAISQPTDL